MSGEVPAFFRREAPENSARTECDSTEGGDLLVRAGNRLVLLLLFVTFFLSSCNEPSELGGGGSFTSGSDFEVLVANSLGETLSFVSYGEAVQLSRDAILTGLAPSALLVDGDRGYVVNSLSHTIQVVDLRARRTLHVVSVGLGKNPISLCLARSAPEAAGYVAEFVAGSVDLVDLRPGGGVRAEIDLAFQLPRDPGGPATRPFPSGLCLMGETLFVALSNLRSENGTLRAGGPGVVVAIDAQPGSETYHQILSEVSLPARDPISVLPWEEGGGFLVVCCAGDYESSVGFVGNGALVFLDAETQEVAGTLGFERFGGASPFEALFSGDMLYIADGRQGRVFTAEVAALRRFLSEGQGGDLSEALAEVITLPGTGMGLSYASGLAAWGPYVFVTEFNHDQLVVLRGGRIVDSFVVGDGPDAVAVFAGTYGEATLRADAGPDHTCVEGSYLRFDASGSTGRGIASYLWDFDDRNGVGVDATGEVVFSRFSEPGRFVVTLTVRDAAGNEARDTAFVTVYESGSPESLSVIPQESILLPGEELHLEARVLGEAVPAVWRTAEEGVVDLSPDGTCLALSAGEALLEATWHQKEGSCLVRVGPHREVLSAGRWTVSVSLGGTEVRAKAPAGQSEVLFSSERAITGAQVWAERFLFLSTSSSLTMLELPSLSVTGQIALEGVGAIASGADFLFAARGGKLAAVKCEGGEIFELEAEGQAEVTALACDGWGRLWIGRKDGSLSVLAPPFVLSEEKVRAADMWRVLLPEGVTAGCIYSSLFQEKLIAGDARRDLVVELPLRGGGEATESVRGSESVPLREGGLGISALYELCDGSLIAESRRAAQLLRFSERGGGSPSVSALPWERREELLAQRARPQEAVWADRLRRYQVRGKPGAYMNPLLVLGPAEGGGVGRGSTDVVSLGDRQSPSGPSDPDWGGAVEVGFGGRLVVDGPGPDLVVFENPFRIAGGGIFCEAAVVRVSQDGVLWHEFPWRADLSRSVADPRRYEGLAGRTPVRANFNPQSASYFPVHPHDPAAGGDRFDLATLHLRYVRYVQIVDPGGLIDDAGSAPAFSERGADIDAVCALHTAWDPFGGPPDTEPPVARIRVLSPPSGPEIPLGSTVVLDAGDSRDNEGIVLFAWDLSPRDGDRTVQVTEPFSPDALGLRVEFSPSEPGEWTVSLLVADSAGNTARATTTLRVRP